MLKVRLNCYCIDGYYITNVLCCCTDVTVRYEGNAGPQILATVQRQNVTAHMTKKIRFGNFALFFLFSKKASKILVSQLA